MDWHHRREVTRYDPRLKTFTRYAFQNESGFSSVNDVVWDLVFDQTGDLWIGASSGLYRMLPGSGEVELFNHLPNDPTNLVSRAISCIFEDRTGIIWFSGGMEGVNKFRPGNSFLSSNTSRITPTA